jgi:tRNA-dihydrouridine synthase
MVGITNRAFRALLFELGGPDWYMTEMASAEAFLAGGRHEEVYLDPSPEPARTSVQFAAKTPEILAAACVRLACLPEASRPAGIDINLGCAAPHIRSSGKGAALLDNPDRAIAMVAAARARWEGILSCKIRISSSAGIEGTLKLAARLADEGLNFITVHPRLDSQKFRRSADHAITALFARSLSIPVIANGDLADAEQAGSLFADAPVHSYMIGRQAVRRPWIFAHGRSCARKDGLAGEPIDLCALALRFIDLVEQMLPFEWQKESCRRFFCYFSENMSFAHHFRFSLANAPTLDAMRQFCQDYFTQLPRDRFIAL